MKRDRIILYFGSLFFFLALISSIYFFLERNLGDSGWRAYYILNKEMFCPSHGRWILFFYQFPAFISMDMQGSLKQVLIFHALGDVFLFGNLFYLSYFYFRNKLISLSILLSYVFGIGVIYFIFPDLEKHLASPFLIILGFHLKEKRFTFWKKFLISIPLFVIVVLSHPLLFFPLLLLLLFYFHESESRFKYVYVILFVFLLIIRVLLADKYEATMFGDLLNKSEVFQKLANIRIVFFKRPLLIVLFILVSFLVYKKRGKLLFFLNLLGFMIYQGIVLLLVPAEHILPYQIPYAALLIFLLFSNLDFENFNKFNWKWFYITFVSVLFWESAVIFSHREHHKENIEFITNVSKRAIANNQDKIVVNHKPQNSSSYTISESAIISTIKLNKTVVIVEMSESVSRVEQIRSFMPSLNIEPIFKDNAFNLVSLRQLYEEDYFKYQDRMWVLNNLNKKYFKLKSSNFVFYESLE